MRTCLLLHSKADSGKSMITEFIEEHVLGKLFVITSNDLNTIIEAFNRELLEKSLLVLEVMPASTQEEWKASSECFKHIITGKKLMMYKKNKTSFLC